MSNQFDDKRSPLQFPNIDQIVNYLQALGWNETKSRNPNARIFLSASELGDEPFSVVLPLTMKLKDSRNVINDAIESISAITELDFDEVVKEINLPRTDIFDFRMMPNRDKDRQDFISVEEINIITEELRNTFAFSAQSEAEPEETRKESIPQINETGKKFARNLRFAHTFKGSFGLSIEAELTITQPRLPMKNLPPIQAPFERRVLERLAKGVISAEAATKNDNVDLIVSSYKTGLNANMCSSLSKLFEQTQLNKVETRFLWSPAWLPENEEHVTSVVLNRKTAIYLRMAAEKLRKEESPTYVTLIGQVMVLQDVVLSQDDEEEIPIDQQGYGHRIVLWVRHKDEDFKVSTWLTELDHDIAIQAYSKKSLLTVSGTLEKRKRSRVLLLPHAVQIVPNSPESIP
ncbi:MAG: hypothetical protein JST89_20565 [Cyanobacteria bacterium SZAS-4]|nr:hypothetical protein [Cyanobacteria bacterium SZAS-4]